MSTKKNITITGAGLVGSLLAVVLAKRGHQVNVYERRADARKANLYAGRSINLALSDRGWKAIRAVGLEDEIKKVSIPMYHRAIHNADGTYTRQPYGKEGQAIYSVSRGGLNIKLMELADELPNVNLHFEHKCLGSDLETGTAHFEHQGKEFSVEADLLFGADGAFSAIRNTMMKRDRFSYSQEYISHGYKELNIYGLPDGGFRMEKEALHIWPRGEYMLIALPNPDGSFTLTLFFPFEGNPSFSSLDTTAKARQFFAETFTDAYEMMPDFDEQWERNPTSSLCIIRCYPWKMGRTTLIGDASHAIVPFYGQGMNSGFEDCDVLNQLIDKYDDNWEDMLQEFQVLRKPDGDAIAELAMRNFIEMRDLTGDKDFLLQKKIEGRFYEKYPEKWVPLYSMVTFSHTRYSEALAKGKYQDKIMAEIMAMPNIHENWNSQAIEDKMLALLAHS